LRVTPQGECNMFLSCVKLRWLAVAAIAIAVIGFQGAVYATVLNQSFENDALSDGSSVNNGYADDGTMSNWSYHNAGLSGWAGMIINNPLGAPGNFTMYGASGNNPPWGGTGANDLEIQAAGGTSAYYVYQDVGTIVSGNEYDLIAAVGVFSDYGLTSKNTHGWEVDAWVGIMSASQSWGSYLARTKVSYDNNLSLHKGSLGEVYAKYVADGTHAGETLRIFMANTAQYNGGNTPGWSWVEFDNVRLTPEPGTFALVATGLIGLLAYAWRKRR
jgi:hypothetical protein